MRKSPDETTGPAAASDALTTDELGRLVEKLARALRKPPEASRSTSSLSGRLAGPNADRTGELPQILKPGYDEPQLPMLSTWRAEPDHATWLAALADRLPSSPLGLATGLGAVALLLLASIGTITGFAGLDLWPEKPVPALSRIEARPTSAAPAPDPVQQSERLIARGDFAGARALLGQAAAAGDAAATLALAETFDPNMLAAWGARGQTADVGTAKQLYARALAAGEARARQRLQALDAAP